MKRNKKTNMPRHILIFWFITCISTMLGSCGKEDHIDGRSDYLIVSKTQDSEDLAIDVDVPIEGGRDTFYISSNRPFDIFFQTDDEEEWLVVERVEDLQNNITRLIVETKPLEGTFSRRSGILSLSSKANFLAAFVKIYQGHRVRFSENFAWLQYGSANPFDETRETLITNWSAAQQSNGWTSTIPDGAAEAHCYGRNGHVKLGSESHGANLISPIIPGIEKDSILLLSFNAVSYIAPTGAPDANKLTVEILNGCIFEDGTNKRVIELGYFDHLSPMAATNMWEQSLHALSIKKPDTHVDVSTIQIRLTTGSGLSDAGNRVFVDNVHLYTVFQYGENMED